MFGEVANPPESEENLPVVIENARTRFRTWRLRSLYSAVGLFITCAFVVPFLYGHSLHSYWDSFGRFLILVAMALLVVLVYCTGLLWGAWLSLRDLQKSVDSH